MDLVIMAAGLGSRFGGLKQLEPVDNENNFIIDYSIFDAIRAGFDHVVFIIKEELLNLFKQTIGNRIEQFVSVDYVFQNNNNIPNNFNVPSSRTKPFGTGHAILCAKDKIKSDFIVINGDDFYGKESFEIAYNFLKNNNIKNEYALIGYEAIKTISDNGSVKRGVCIYSNEVLHKIIESSIEINDEKTLKTTPLIKNEEPRIINNSHLVSMNLFAFKKSFLSYLDNYFYEFLEENKNDLSSCEFFLPFVVSDLVEKKEASVSLLSTPSRWFGITYKEDLPVLKSEILKLKAQNVYPYKLWN